ncbi:ABC-2 transporter permease [[Clostridium] symbiosum]|uniref:ABC-2 transporter permease n=1 Tax=Clostridium symbiosum TaxID=1512 RepID=UPI001D08FA48|nr:ABC-2 transporter permease [[Clostridium] symbiosum]MCB6610632.1 ABC-2 transporter permease [[Clostridium] symbiosum]MCB6930922.1 ABC-2 transporter permease [[Clostridium] symbiosum]
MKGLLYKEICMFRPQLKSWAMVLVIFAVYGVIFRNVSMILMMTSMLGLMACFNSFSYDKQFHCNEYLAAMPVSRKEMVWSKYIFMLGLDLILSIISLIFTAGYAFIAKEPVIEILAGVGAVLVVTVFMQAILMPMVYIMGIEKARYVNIVIWMLPWVLVMLFKDRLPKIEEWQIIMVLKIMPFIAAVFMVASVCISVSSFRKKDL